jgi:hypothetical protein
MSDKDTKMSVAEDIVEKLLNRYKISASQVTVCLYEPGGDGSIRSVEVTGGSQKENYLCVELDVDAYEELGDWNTEEVRSWVESNLSGVSSQGGTVYVTP